MASFRGGPVLKVDDKGRVTVPSKFCALLQAAVQGQVVVAKCPDGCLALYPLPVSLTSPPSLRNRLSAGWAILGLPPCP